MKQKAKQKINAFLRAPFFLLVLQALTEEKLAFFREDLSFEGALPHFKLKTVTEAFFPNFYPLATMPIYEYKCPQCGHVFEEWVKLSEAHSEEPCPECGTKSPRMLSHTSFVLKGGGWYVTDYGYRKNHPDEGGSEKASQEKTSDASSKTPPPPPASPKTESPKQSHAEAS